MYIQAGPLRVAEELIAQPHAVMGALYQAGNFHHHEVLSLRRDHAQGRLHRGERVVRDLRLGSRTPGQKSGLPGVGLGQEPNIGQELQLKKKNHGFALFPTLGQPWLLIRRRSIMGVPPPPFSTLSNQPRLLVDDISEHLIRTRRAWNHPPDNSTQRDSNVGVGTVGAPLILAAAMLTTLNVESAVELEVEEGVDAGVADDKCAATITPITTIGATLRTEFLPQETHAAVTTVTSLYIQSNCIDHSE